MTANYTEACFQAHKRFRSSAILFLFFFIFCFFHSSLYILNAFVLSSPTRKVFGLKLRFCECVRVCGCVGHV